MTKRIKIERPEDLKEGMRVELKTARFSRVYEGKLYKPSNDPSDKRLDISMSTSSGHRVYVSVIDERGDFTEIKSIHRLIDGIEDVVVGDVLISGKDLKSIRKVLDVRPNLVIISDPLRSGQANYYGRNATLTFEDLKIDSWEIYISEQKIELTETEAKEIIAEVKGVETEGIVIKKDE